MVFPTPGGPQNTKDDPSEPDSRALPPGATSGAQHLAAAQLPLTAPLAASDPPVAGCARHPRLWALARRHCQNRSAIRLAPHPQADSRWPRRVAEIQLQTALRLAFKKTRPDILLRGSAPHAPLMASQNDIAAALYANARPAKGTGVQNGHMPVYLDSGRLQLRHNWQPD